MPDEHGEEEEYEGLPPSASLRNHMLAGACAGVMEHGIMYPVDCVKTRMQCLKPTCEVRYGGVIDGLTQLFRNEGYRRAIRGVGAMVGGAAPAHALFFASYESGKATLTPIIGNEQLAYAISGVCATIFHDSIMTPADAVKQRVQMYNSPYTSSWHCFTSVVRTQGFAVLYRAFFTQLMTNLPYQVTHFMAYENGQNVLNKDRRYRPHTHVLSGAFAGAFAAAVTNPLDVCKTVLNTQDLCALSLSDNGQQVRGLMGAARAVYTNEGLLGFFRGLRARVVFQMPSAAISWSVYELFKALLKGENLNLPAPDALMDGEMKKFPTYVKASSEEK